MVFSKFFDDAVKNQSRRKALPLADKQEKKKERKRPSSKKRGTTSQQHNEKASTNKNNNEVKQPYRKRKRTRPPRSALEKTSPPSQEALALSATLKELSSRKRLGEALDMYWDPVNDNIRDGHHGCIMVDCCSRCGNVEQGERVVTAMRQSGTHMNVETKTALLKGYAHSGMMEKGAILFREMCKSKARRDRPNVRTLNTLLRGCLWTSASINNKSSSSIALFGGVITSEEAWGLYKSVSLEKKQQRDAPLLDSSSYEYSVGLLCQALLCDTAVVRIHEMKHALDCDGDPAAKESLAVCLLSVARSYALLGRVREATDVAERALNASSEATSLLGASTTDNQQLSTESKKMSRGGKRAWRKRDATSPSESTQVTRRTTSNNLFRTHRLSEIGSEAQCILTRCRKNQPRLSPSDTAFFLCTRLMCFSGGGTTDLSTTRECQANGEDSSSPTAKDTAIQLMNSLWHSFGLKMALEYSSIDTEEQTKREILSEQDCRKISDALDLSGMSAIDDDGYIDFDRVFKAANDNAPSNRNEKTSKRKSSDCKRQLCIELGSGYGEWIVGQAQSNPSKDYVAVELRSDRVAHTFSKAMLYNRGGGPLENLCCVGSECGSFLRNRIKKGSVSTIFVNHPEPPTQTYGSNATDLLDIAKGGDEMAHMLNSETLLSAAYCLAENSASRLAIVTDNRWYARLICATLVKVIQGDTGLIRSVKFEGQTSGLRQIEVFPREASAREQTVVLYEGQPSESIGHAMSGLHENGTSYFDRLWRSGAGSHAECKKRFVIVMERSSDGSGNTISSTVFKGIERKNRKKSEAKQRRRNERRLKKRFTESSEA